MILSKYYRKRNADPGYLPKKNPPNSLTVLVLQGLSAMNRHKMARKRPWRLYSPAGGDVLR